MTKTRQVSSAQIETSSMTEEVDINPTSVVDSLIHKYKSFAKKSAESVLGLAATIIRVEEELGGRDRRLFYETVGLAQDGATTRKLRAIGEKLPRFQPYLGILPNAWTTLSALASMSDEDFKKVVESKALHPCATMNEIAAILGKSRTKSHREFRVFVDLSAIGVRTRQAEFARKLKQLVDEYHLELKAPDHQEELSTLIDEVDDVKQAA